MNSEEKLILHAVYSNNFIIFYGQVKNPSYNFTRAGNQDGVLTIRKVAIIKIKEGNYVCFLLQTN